MQGMVSAEAQGRRVDRGDGLPGWRQTAAVASQDSQWTRLPHMEEKGSGGRRCLLSLGGRMEEDCGRWEKPRNQMRKIDSGKIFQEVEAFAIGIS
uniref:Uncharacterized protein n=1 Tax=Oryza glaberrima TaxID=4538 RepID=I1PII9_ORYGL